MCLAYTFLDGFGENDISVSGIKLHFLILTTIYKPNCPLRDITTYSLVLLLLTILQLKGCVFNQFLTQYLRLSEKASTPHLDRQYPPPVRDSLPRTLATFTTLPWAFFRSGRN